ncbi:hypothetical protein [Actinoallomurus sp. CA-150999]|uniref:hypothetical protein n=1 Tax=Actinoallomurus sp. CA-150999 TaxID=3239887 RepID=UPI003D8C2E15
MPAGTVIGMLLIGRMLRQETQARAMGPLAALAGVPLIVCALRPGPVISVALWGLLWGLSGVALAYQMVAQAEFVRAVPDRYCGQSAGLAGSAITAVQGIGVLLGGALADHVGAASAVTVAGTASLVVGTPLAVAWQQVRANASSSPVAAAEDGVEARVAA